MMGKMKFKLSHVMPHAWFYKLREVGRPRTHPFKTSDTPRKSYTSPINHKAIDIPFPADPITRSPHIEFPPSDTPPISELKHLRSPSNHIQPSIVSSSVQEVTSLLSGEINELWLVSQTESRDNSYRHGLAFDVRELERRLKALDWEDRPKYYASPLLQSAALPSPMIDGSLSIGMEILHDDKFVGKHGHCACDADDHSANACTKHGLSAVLVNREMDKIEFDEVVLTEDFARIGEALCRSINESNMHSTSSSDTGIERGSSSVWERDVFSITSDCSEALTSTCTDEHEVRVRHNFANLRERMSPNARATTERSFHEDSQRAHVDRPSSPLKTRHIAGSGLNERKSFPRASYKEHHKTGKKFHENARISSPEMHGSTISLGATNGKNNRDDHALNTSKKVSTRKALGLQYSAERPISHNSSRNKKGKPEADRLPGNSPSSLLMDNSRMMDSLSSPDVRNYAFDEDDSGEDDRRSVHSRMSESSRFSYAKCKERLLSSRTLFEQGPQGGTASLCDKENSSNYSKFKLKQMDIVDSMRTSNMDTHVKAGSFKRGSVRRDIRNHVHDVTMAVNAPIHSALDESRDYHDGSGALLDKQGTPFYQRDYQDVQSREGSSSKGGLEEEEPSHLKSTLHAVREKTVDPNFQKFTLQSTLVGGADLSSPIRTSQVFDSFAMVKCSYDPRHDFRESMVEMIMEKGLHTSHDMVELLQCYLTLNAEAYHDTIVKVFTEVWSEMFRHT